MKRIAVAAAAALAGVLTAAAGGCSASMKNLASLSSNWYYDSSYTRIQPTFNESSAERLSYKVTQAEKSSNSNYSAEFADGTYTTEFYVKKITSEELDEITLESMRGEYTRSLGKEGYMYLYYYSSELNIPSVTYTCGSESKTFENQTVTKESYFLAVQERLSPVYTLTTEKRTVPKGLKAKTIDEACLSVDMRYESFYSLDGDEVKTYITDNSDSKNNGEFTLDGLNGHANSVFDAAYLDVVVRAMKNISSSLNQIIGVYSPGIELRDYIISGSDAALSDDKTACEAQLADLQAILQGKGLLPSEGRLTASAVSVTYNGGNYSGVSQTYWFATDENNQTRTLMVKYREPLAYNAGCLEYLLESIENFPA